MATNRIKGITIEIDGDSKKLTDALKSVNKEVTNAQKALGDVNKLLKLDPGNTDLLVQKQKYLTEAIDATKKKLDEEKAALEQLKNAPQTDETIRDQETLTREIVDTEQALEKLTDQYRQFGSVSAQEIAAAGEKVESFGNKLKSAGDSVAGVGRDLTAKVTVPIVGGMTAAIKSATDFESAFTGVTKTVDGTEEEYKQLSDWIKEASTRMASSKEDIAGVMEIAGQLGVNGVKELESFTETMIMLGDTTNLSSEEAATALARFMNITGVSYQDASKLGSAVVDLGNNFATSESEIVGMSTRLASAGTIAGLSATDILALAASMSSVGIEAEAGGTAMSQTLKQIQSTVELAASGSDGAKEKLETFAKVAGMSAEQFSQSWKKEPIEAIQAFIRGLGNLDEESGSTITMLDELGMTGIRQSNMLQALSLSSEMLGKAVSTSGSAFKENTALMDEAAKRYETTESQMVQFGEEVKNLAIEFGETLLPYLKQAMEAVRNWIHRLQEMSPAQQEMIVKIAAIAAAIGPLLLIAGQLMSSMGGIITATGKLMQAVPQITSFFTAINGGAAGASGAMGALGGSIGAVAAPIAAIVAAIGVLVAAFIHLWDTNEQFRNDMAGIWNDIVLSVNEAFASITEAINSFGFDFANIVEVLKALWDTYTQFVGVEFKAAFEAVAAIVKTVAGVFEGLGQIITGIMNGEASKAVSGFGTLFESVFGGLATVISTPFKIIFGFIDQLLQMLGTSLPAAVSGVGETIGNVATSIGEFFGGLGEKVSSGLSSVGSAIGEILSDVATSIADFFTGVGENISAFFNPIAETVMNTVNAVYTEIQPLLEAFQYLFETVVMAIQILWSQAWTQIKTTFTNIWNEIVAFFTPIIQMIQQTIVMAWTTIQQVTITVFTAVQEFILSVWNAIVSFITPILAQIQAVIQNTWTQVQTITNTVMNAVKTAIVNIWNSIKSAIQPILDGIVNTIKNKLNEAMNFIKNLASKARQWGADIVNGLAAGIRGAIGAVTSAVTSVADAIRSRIHFSRPDVGPLREYERWMPDMMAGLAQGIRDNIDMVQSAMADVGSAMAGSMNVDYTPQLDKISGNLATMNAAAAAGPAGDLYIPVYIGSELIDEIVVEAGQRNSYRSGGR